MEEKKKVLIIEIVEDERSLRQSLVEKFTSEGFSVSTATDGPSGLRLALEKHPDIIILDVLLPDMDGLAMLKKLREQGTYGKEVPVIVLTNVSSNNEEINQRIAATTPAFFLEKTHVTLDGVVDKVKERLAQA